MGGGAGAGGEGRGRGGGGGGGGRDESRDSFPRALEAPRGKTPPLICCLYRANL